MKRRKVWVSSPVYLALSVAMLIAALYSLQFDLTLFSVNLSLCVISVVVVVICEIQFRSHVSSAMKAAKNVDIRLRISLWNALCRLSPIFV